MNKTVKILSMTDETAIIGGYGVVFGGVDLDGETFTKETDYRLDMVPRKPVLFDHSGDSKIGLAELGHVDDIKADDVGLWVQAQLDRSSQYWQMVEPLLAEGKLGWSSGSVAHLTRRDGGVIKSWPIVEFSLTTTPAEPRTVGVERFKSVDNTEMVTEAEAAEDSGANVPEGDEITNDNTETKHMTEQNNVDLSPVLDAISGIGDAVKALNERVTQIEETPDNDVGVAAKGAPAIVTEADHWRYDNIDTADLAFAIGTLNEAKRSGRSRKGASLNMVKALGKRMDSAETLKSESGRVANHAMKSAGIKANEINQSTLANYGDEWVGVFYSGALWESIRHETAIVARLPQMEVPAGAESVVIPVESTDPTWYKVGQAASLSANPGGIPTNTVTASNLGTDNQTMTLAKMGARVLWTGELEEDAVLPYVAQLRRQLAVSGAEYLESAVIDGDTATGASTNINDIAGTPGGTEYWLTVNGFRKLPLVTNTANSRDAGSLTSADFLETVKLMGVDGSNARDVMRTGFIIPNNVHWKALELDDVKTRDVFSGATLENGRLTAIYGYPIYVSYHMHKAQASRLANTAGKIDLDSAGNNTTGSILAVRWDQWMFGYRRRMTLETTRVPAADSTEIVALMRFGLLNRDNEAAAISYNVTV